MIKLYFYNSLIIFYYLATGLLYDNGLGQDFLKGLSELEIEDTKFEILSKLSPEKSETLDKFFDLNGEKILSIIEQSEEKLLKNIIKAANILENNVFSEKVIEVIGGKDCIPC